ncbi:ribonuclease D [Spongiibacter sp. KMU-158]|uniref:Ribonuclease D n=1 Tax=Spongiibacter pelagi TaxID=2760804 RepID=A0A927BZL7_9GAMM|nr:ribonuclease D [Spongiibacter pelagi]MBD2858510.1 ribonuclease D [Spongiibacter pelagi]
MSKLVEYHYIESNDALAAICQRWINVDYLSIDTEFIRRDTFYPIAGLLQLGAEGECALVDPLTITEWSPLIELLTAPNVIKLIHSCSEDLEVFQRLLGCLPKPLLDTQIGAAMAGWGFGLSYQNLVLHGLGLYVDKGETCSDWLQRPLTESQCEYAALDVLYLQRIAPKLCQALEQQGRFGWWQEECDRLINQAENPAPLADYYQRIKNEWKLRPRQRLSLQMLCEWREHEARRRDIPRGRILKDQICFDIAFRQPRDAGSLSRIKNIPPAAVRRDGETILALLEQSQADEQTGLPAVNTPLNGPQKGLFKDLRQFGEQRAEALGLPVELLVRKRDLEALVQEKILPAGLSGWRKPVMGDALLERMQQGAGSERGLLENNQP